MKDKKKRPVKEEKRNGRPAFVVEKSEKEKEKDKIKELKNKSNPSRKDLMDLLVAIYEELEEE